MPPIRTGLPAELDLRPSWACAQALQTLALGNLPLACGPTAALTTNAAPLPPSLSRLTALTSLTLHDITWEHAPAGLPDMPQVQYVAILWQGSLHHYWGPAGRMSGSF